MRRGHDACRCLLVDNSLSGNVIRPCNRWPCNPPPPCESNALVKATVGVVSAPFGTEPTLPFSLFYVTPRVRATAGVVSVKLWDFIVAFAWRGAVPTFGQHTRARGGCGTPESCRRLNTPPPPTHTLDHIRCPPPPHWPGPPLGQPFCHPHHSRASPICHSKGNRFCTCLWNHHLRLRHPSP